MHNKREEVLLWMCKGCQMNSKCPPQLILVSIFHSHSPYELVLSNNALITSIKNITKPSAFQKLSWKISHVENEERAQAEHIQMSRQADALKKFLSGTGAQELSWGAVHSEKCPDEKQHCAELTTADRPGQLQPPRKATSLSRETLCHKEQETNRASDNLSAPLWWYTLHSIYKSKIINASP